MKMFRKKKISINNILLICWLAVSLYIVGVIIAFSLNVIYTDRKEDLTDNQILADRFAENANRDLIAMINTINMIYAEDVNFAKLRQNNLSEFDWQGAAYLLENNLSNRVNSLNHMCGMYFYDMASDQIRFVWNEYPFSGSANLLLREMKSYLKNTLSTYRNYGCFSYEDELYFSYSFGKDGNYVGAVLNLSRYFDASEDYIFAFETEDGSRYPVYGKNELEIRLTEIKKSADNSIKDPYLVTESPVLDGQLKFLLIRKSKTVFELLNHSKMKYFIFTLPLVLGIFGFVLMHGMKHVMFVPVAYIYRKISDIKENRTKVTDMKSGIIEFDEINMQIDHLLKELDTLQKEKYEEKIRANMAQLQYYELQINPHFFLNCLNMINSLLNSNNDLAASDMICALSSHFRYVFQNRKKMVRVEEELSEVQAYCRIYSLKGGVPIALNVEAFDEVMEYRIPVLTIQTFVENSIKHGKREEFLLNIRVQVFAADKEMSGRLCIRISDNGPGYPEELLARLNRSISEFEYKSEHVGIDNLKYRIYLLCGKDVSYRFYNSLLGGAVTELFIGGITDEHIDY